MKIKETYDCIIPQWAVCPIINDDYSGITDKDTRALDDYIKSLPPGGVWSMVQEEPEPYFTWRNDIETMGGDVYDMTYTIFE